MYRVKAAIHWCHHRQAWLPSRGPSWFRPSQYEGAVLERRVGHGEIPSRRINILE